MRTLSVAGLFAWFVAGHMLHRAHFCSRESLGNVQRQNEMVLFFLQDLFQSHFSLPTGGLHSEPSVFHLTWQLFIIAKAKLFPPFPDLVASFNLLICVLAFVFSHISSEERAVDLADSTKLPVRSADGAVDVLGETSISHIHVPYPVQHMGAKCNNSTCDTLLLERDWGLSQSVSIIVEILYVVCSLSRPRARQI